MREADERAFRDFAAGHAASLRRTAYLFCGDWHTAEDLMQASLLKLYQAWHRVQWRDNPSAYARKVLLRTWLDEKRRPWRRAEQRDGEVPDVADSSVDPEAASEQLWARDLVHAALLHVPPRQRAALVLRYFEDLPVSEVAVAMGCSEGTVKSQTARGLAALRAAVVALDRGAVLVS
ncbi:RNA polymerase sigma factor [Saccharothrix algeriensis]|uniref:RNA polymerase sigma-70 factor (Sigma-E family) n=1 Tax=Saccharothrix algeriensis TaxID=173560 RepID=A0A8T8HRU7_9PSEU|nr:SigE family RNA polymerase sigma factor [Saccharothrix algeriensis]MBM7812399.1 RNA polymerase sigma-70 factor (sigma-E family) [Saccharothrix algeriensis]QTR01157.1 SigE family RNA polymerase sigma factor [Saccharothrix algeriensis]